MDLGLMVEGVVELDLTSDRMVLRVTGVDGTVRVLDVQAELAKYCGKDIRLICTPLDSIAELAKLVESGAIAV